MSLLLLHIDQKNIAQYETNYIKIYMREIINIHLGQCGNAIGLKFLEKILEEHGIDKEGNYVGTNDYQRQRTDVFFEQVATNTYRTRSVLVDLEPGPIDTVLGSPLAGLYDPDCFVVGSGGGSNNWAVGHYTQGTEMMNFILDAVRRKIELCDHLEGFQMVQSLGGGAGSGLGSLCLSTLKDWYGNRLIQTFPIFPSPKVSDTIVEPYNTILSMKSLINSCDLCNVIQNEALLNICSNKLKIKNPTYSHLNDIVSSAISNTTCGLRFSGDVNSSLRKQAVNLVPFPRLHFLINSLGPLFPSNQTRNKSKGDDIFRQVYLHQSFLTCEDFRHGRFITSSAIFRGKMSALESEILCFRLQDRRQYYFSYMVANNMQSVHCKVALSNQDISIGSVSNSSVIQTILSKCKESFMSLYRRKAFLHWYTAEGLDEMEFHEASQNVNDLVDEYQRFQNDPVEEYVEERQQNRHV